MRKSLPELKQGQAWQSAQTLDQLDELQDLVDCFKEAVRRVLECLKIGYECFEITGCWANINAPGASHRSHSHPNNFLSGVYCVQVHPGADTISFHDPRNQTGIIRPPVTQLTAENTDQVVVRLENGTLVIFPAYLRHSVEPNTSHQERLTISFNAMFTSFTSTMSKPLW